MRVNNDGKLPSDAEQMPDASAEATFAVPLSFAQQRLWFINQLEPGNPAYNFSSALHLEGQLDVAAMERSLNEIIRRHESFRTSFEIVDGEPKQVIALSLTATLSVEDVRRLDASERETYTRRLIAAEALHHFDLSQRPLLRAVLVHLDEAEHVLIFTMHHIISDAWSMAVLIKEVATLYETFSTGRPSPLAELTIQYADFTLWQREWLQGEVLEQQLAYWRRQLTGIPSMLELPTDKPVAAVRTLHGAKHPFKLPADLDEQLKLVSQRQGATLFMTLLAAFQTLLHRYTGQRDILVGTSIAGRNQMEIEGLIGFFVNMLVMRTDLSGDPSFSALLDRVREVVIGGLAHQDIPFEKLVEELQPERSLTHSPFFQVVLVLQNAPVQALELPGLKVRLLEGVSETAIYNLTLMMEETEDGLGGVIEYSTDLYDESTIARLCRHFEQLLTSALQHPRQPLSTLALLNTEEEAQLLYGWNQTEQEYPHHLSVHQLFEQQVRRSPEAIAVAGAGGQLTYRELNARSNQLARYLRRQGVGAETVVALCLERSIEQVISVLGVLKAGGTYLPLDPHTPLERLSWMMEEAQVGVVITTGEWEEVLPSHWAQVVKIEELWGEIAGQSEEDLAVEVDAGQLAYVMYTSGSTGRPKGVMIPHRAILRLFSDTRYVQLDATSRLAHLSNPSFDAATFELWGALLHGARLVVVTREVALSPALLAQELEGQGVTTLFLTSALFNQVAAQAPESLRRRREVLFGGEAADPGRVRQLLDGGCAARLINGYGPTESTTFASWEEVREVAPEARTIPIGRPLSNTTLYVLDGHLRAVAVGVVGELYIGGEGLARGYLHQPGMTAERFVPHPHSRRAGERLYRTGDLCRRLADGRVEFVGRMDRQVKVRGFRIELGEVEAVLGGHPGVAECVVEVEGAQAEEKRLVGYVVLREGASVGELRSYVGERLPEYMVPGVMVELEGMPLTANGKVDRGALKEARGKRREREEAAEEREKTAVEEILVGVWEEVLGVEGVRVEDNFFELGGHSLLATQVMTRVREAFGVEVPLRVLFERGSIAGVAEEIEGRLRGGGGERAPAIERVDREQRLPLSFAQQRLWFLDQLEPGMTAYNMPLAIRLRGALDVAALSETLDEIVRRHEVLRTTFVVVEGEPRQLIHPPQPLTLSPFDLSTLPASEREITLAQLVHDEAVAPFDLSRGPLLRVQLLRLSVDEHVLSVTMHHIISDGWSMGVLVREVASLYEAYLKDEASPLAELPIQYADYSVWQRRWLTGAVLDTQLSYWREQLAGAPAALELPTDRPRPPIQTHRGAILPFALPEPLTAALTRLSRRESVTLFMTLLAAFFALLSRYSGEPEVVIGTPIANRTRRVTEELIGFFVNTLALRVDGSAEPSFTELLRRVREVCVQAYGHQEVAFEQLVEELEPERSLSHSPIFQVMMVMQNAPRRELRLPALELSMMDVGEQDVEVKFDLTLTLMEEGEQIGCWLSYRRELFDEETIGRVRGHYERLLSGLVAEPWKAVSRQALLWESEEAEVLAGWGASERMEEGSGESLVAEFEEEVRRGGGAGVALEYEGERLSYEELNRRANQVGHYLRRRGVGPETLVGLCMSRSVEMLVSMLGILKAGGGYLPLDPSFPAERLAFMLQDSRASMVVTQQCFADRLPADQVELVFMDADWHSISNEAEENPLPLTTKNNIAYVIYTSGSTGRPKGVVIEQRQILNYIGAVNKRAGIEREARFAMVQPLSVDSSQTVIFPALLTGGTVHVISRERATDAAALSEYLTRHPIDCLKIAPSHLAALQASVHAEQLMPRRWLIIGGEASRREWVAGLHQMGSGCAIFNHYGPTEATVGMLMYRTERESAGEASGNVPMGKPLANTQAYVLDRNMQPAPVGVPGELYIGGLCLARGYLHHPEKTAEKFIPHPFSTEPGARLYRTGDVVRYAADGNLSFLGRRDDQVKIRGYRVEFGEIEAALAQHPAIRELILLALPNKTGDQRLVAYLVARQEQAAASELRSFLQQKLPEYMIPSAFVWLSALPLTPHGKVDRHALPAPEQERPRFESDLISRQMPIVEMVSSIWSEVLDVTVSRPQDNFFDLGGHSLLATQTVSRLREAFGVEVPLRQLFEKPTVAGLSRYLQEQLSAGASASVPAIERVDREQRLPLSFAQQRLWFLDRLEPGSTVYNMPLAIRLRGTLEVTALEQTLNEIVRRHEVLRTTFIASDGEPQQVIHPPQLVTLAPTDLSTLSETERESAVTHIVRDEAVRPFDLSRGPLLRVRLLRLSVDEHVLSATMHHIITDGWSLGVLVREVAALYEAYLRGEASPLAELSVQYADYALWQREWLTGAVLEQQLSYWREQLADIPAVIELPTDRPRPPVQSHRGAHYPFRFPPALAEALSQQCRRSGVTLFMGLLGAFHTLLWRYGNVADVLVGTDIANRTRGETEQLIGFFVNQLVLRGRLRPGMSYEELLGQEREVCLGGYGHQEVPFEKLVEELEPGRSLSYAPLFQVKLVLQNAPTTALQLPELELSTVASSISTAKLDLVMMLEEVSQGLIGSVEYSTDLYDESTIARLCQHFEQLLSSALNDPRRPLSTLALLNTEEEAQLLYGWNQTEQEYPRHQAVHQMFEQQVALSPAAIAVTGAGAQLTYGELNARANQLARYLRQQGVGAETVVALCLERSIEQVISVLGVLKAGGTYLPLDPHTPLERLSWMMEEAQVGVVITTGEWEEVLPSHPAQVVKIDEEWGEIAGQSDENLTVEVDARQLAYIIYTSGSTGRPKGVMIPHRGLVNYLSWCRTAYPLHEGSSVPLHSSLSFDLSVTSLYGALVVGQTVEVVAVGAELESLAEGLRGGRRYGVVKLTPGHLQVLSRQLGEGWRNVGSVGALVVGGEQLLSEWVKYWREEGREVAVANEYGPTETVVGCSVEWVGAEGSGERGAVAIGRAIANVEMYVLGGRMEAVAPGVVGELYIGGEGVGRGYVRQPGLTAERFVPHPYSRRGGERLYRSGDLCRRLADGRLEFVGRVDRQVKVRGFRIELGEIEVALATHPNIDECVVVSREDRGGEKRLAAYVVSEEDMPGTAELRRHLQQYIPEYMLPSVFVRLDQIPLTANGKVDERSLPEPTQYGSPPEGGVIAARTPIEELIVGMWSEVLGVTVSSVQANFFELGGHSLLATQLISRVLTTFGLEIPLRSIFENPTIAELANLIDARLRGGQAVAQSPPLLPVARGSRSPVSYAQQRLWFLEQMEPGNTLFNIPAALRLTGQLNVTALLATFSEVLQRHEVLRTTFDVNNREPVQQIHPAQPCELPIIDLTALEGSARSFQVERLLAKAAQTPFDLSRGPLLRVRLLRLSAEEHVLSVTMHHIISDGWSLGVLVREVATLYEAYLEGEASPLAELPVQYADYALWQREWLTGEVLEQQLSYWREQLADIPAVIELPTDRPRPPVQTHRGAHYPFHFPQSLAEALSQQCRRSGVTLFMGLLGAFHTLLWRYGNVADVLVGTDIANRTRGETEQLIGFFVNQLVLRGRLRPGMSYEELLGQEREVCLGGYGHQEVPFEKLVEELEPGRSLSYAPLFQVKLVLQNAPTTALQLPGLRLSAVGEAGESGTAKFDLTVMMEEAEDGLGGVVEYSTDLYDESTVARLCRHFEQLLSSALDNPRQSLSTLTLLNTEEEAQLLYGWNQTEQEYPRHQAVHQMFEQQVALSPAAIAVTGAGAQLTYGELNARANQLARYLRQQGVGAETVVALCLERSIEQVICVLAVLKAGGTYLPLDPHTPLERLSWMMEEAQVGVVITTGEWEEVLPSHWAQVVKIDEEWGEIAGQSEEDLAVEVDARQLAYIIYTSGSTGRPKGVMIPHRGLVNYLSWCRTAYPLHEGSSVPLHSSLSFDLSVTSLYGALVVGQTVEVVAVGAELESLAEGLRGGRRYGVVKLTPGHLQVLSRQLGEGWRNVGSVGALVVGGEQLLSEWVKYWREEGREVAVANEYGPTETVVGCSVEWVGAEGSGERGAVAIGRAIANVEMYVLGERMEVVAPGVVGELYIGGEGVGRGYVRQPGLTAERFVPHPYSRGGGERLYRSGDLCRRLADGRLEYVDRTDRQVKVRGYRIELAEIEATLGEHPSVQECVVEVRGEGAAEKRLVAYVVMREGEQASKSKLQGYMGERLPDYMIPALVIELEKMPLTANGKVDRSALPASEHSEGLLTADITVARTPIEELIVGMWSEVLGVTVSSVQANFFELGGHSLLATQLISRVRDTFGIEVQLRVLFEKPTVAELAHYVEEELGLGRSLTAPPPLQRVSREQKLPLSFAQQRLWFLDQLEPDSAFYNIPTAVYLTGHLDIAALEQTLNELIRRHEVLRTTFSVSEGEPPQQRIHPPQLLTLAPTDLSTLSEVERQSTLVQLVRDEAVRPFDLSRGPLLRVRLLRLSAEEHVLGVTMHHIISDGWSLGVLVREVATLYEAYLEGEASPLAELPVQYADYALWQREWLTGAVLEQQLSYWREQLADIPAVIELPTDRPRPPVQTHRGAHYPFRFPLALAEALTQQCRRSGVTLFMGLLGAFHTLLWRYSNVADVLVGTDIANRTRGETEQLIGFFVNQLVLRGRLRPGMSYEELLGQEREVCLGGYGHQEVPFEKLVEELEPGRSLSYAPLFQVKLVLQNAPTTALQLPGLRLSAVGEAGESGTAKFDLTVMMEEAEDGLGGVIEYSTDLYDESTVARLCRHFEQLLSSALNDPRQPLSTLTLLSAEEEAQLLYGWNQTEQEYPRHLSVHQLFEQQVVRSPEAIAVTGAGGQLSYHELNARANQLARYLRQQGVGDETVVALCLERSIEQVICVLAVLKAGGTYLPLDPHTPLERLSWMMEEAQVGVVLTTAEWEEVLPSHWAQVVRIDEEWGEIVTQSEENLAVEVDARQLAYVMYTSGSTGRPKGVMIPHRAILRLFSDTRYVQLDATSRLAHLSNPSFDAATFELWGALLHGARLVVVTREVALSPALLAQELEGQGITTLFLTSALFNQVVAQAPESLRGRREVLFGGEAADPGRVRQLLDGGCAARLINGYGPTESTTFASWEEVREVAPEARTIPIGSPLSNTTLYVLDGHLRAVALGVVGELYIGGEGLARGYLHQPGMTAERFVPHPHGRRAGERLYHTGDLCRRLADGRVEFVGRVDRQVKVRGFRIELGEVEAVLGGHPGVAECVVEVEGGQAEEKRLVGYVVLREGAGASVGELRRHVGERLPEYMVPGVMVELEGMPLTANGKVDRGALREARGKVKEREEEERERTAVEEILAGVWEEVLGVEGVRVEDNFFELGGHSLLATQVMTRVREAFGVEVPLRALFEKGTVAELALVVEEMLIEEIEELSAGEVKELSQKEDEDLRRLTEDS